MCVHAYCVDSIKCAISNNIKYSFLIDMGIKMCRILHILRAFLRLTVYIFTK